MPLQISISNRIDDLARNGSGGDAFAMEYENLIEMLYEDGTVMQYEH